MRRKRRRRMPPTRMIMPLATYVLAMANKPTSEFLVAVGSASVGGLAGLLAPTPVEKS